MNSEHVGRRVIFIGKHPHEGETGTILGIERTICGTAYRVQLDGIETQCFLFDPDKEARLLPEVSNANKRI